MNKQEFLDRLRTALNGRVASGLVMENINYYENYINTEIRKGRSEEEVLDSLGDPRLLAKTIVQTQGGSASGAYSDVNYRSTQYQGDFQSYQESARKDMRGSGSRIFRIPTWLVIILALLIVFLLVIIFFSLLSFLAPLILIVAAVFFVVQLFLGWLK